MTLIHGNGVSQWATAWTWSEGWPAELPVHTVYVKAPSSWTSIRLNENKVDQVYNWAIAHGYDFDNTGSGKATNHPVQTLDWYDCAKWCNSRSEKEGLTPCYYTDTSQRVVYKSGQVDIGVDCVKWEVNGYRLPTEAEWGESGAGRMERASFSVAGHY